MNTNTKINTLERVLAGAIEMGWCSDKEAAELRATLEAAQPAAQQGDGELPQDEQACLLDVISHHSDFIAACHYRREACVKEGDTENAAYWAHQIATLNRMVDQAHAALAQRVAIEPPSFSRDPDGDLALDWHVGDDALSVSFGADGRVAWAATIAGKSFSGSEQVAQRAGSAGTPVHMMRSLRCDPPGGWFDATEEEVANLAHPAYETRTLYTAPPAAVQPDSVHPDDAAVDRFAQAMKEKMAASRAKGRGGWDDPNQCLVQDLAIMLVEHVGRGDPVDVGNFCMMIWNRVQSGYPLGSFNIITAFINCDRPAQPDSGRDAARLDFLAHYGAGLRTDGGGWYLEAPYHTGIGVVDNYVRYPMPRQVIDAAVAAAAPQKKEG